MSEKPQEKIVFLDIDGVLNSTRTHWAKKGDIIPTPFDPAAIGMLNQLCADHDASVVVISIWAKKIDFSEPGRVDVREVMRTAGFTGHFKDDWRIDDVTTHDRTLPIQRYCDKHDIRVKDCLILDDEPPAFMSALFKQRWVKPNGFNGFLFQDYLRADAILAGRPLTKEETTLIDHMEGRWNPSQGRGA